MMVKMDEKVNGTQLRYLFLAKRAIIRHLFD
jgi:hypothetical protein